MSLRKGWQYRASERDRDQILGRSFDEACVHQDGRSAQRIGVWVWVVRLKNGAYEAFVGTTMPARWAKTTSETSLVEVGQWGGLEVSAPGVDEACVKAYWRRVLVVLVGKDSGSWVWSRCSG